MSKTYKKEIFGKTYHIKSSADPAHVDRIVGRLDEEMNRVAREARGISFCDTLLLAALNTVEQLLEAEKEAENIQEVMENGGFDDR